MTHEERVAIATELARRIVETYGDAVLAVFITSSTAKGLDRAHSDLELTAVLRDGTEIEEKSYIHRGILIEISYEQESKFLREAARLGPRWPQQADGFRSRIVLFERDGWTARLDEAVAASDGADPSPALILATCALIESRDKVRNAHLAADRLDLRVEAFWVAEAAANLVLLLNGRHMITTRWFYTRAFECPQRPADFRERMEILMGVTSASDAQVAEAAETLTADLTRLVTAQGITVESDTLLV